jgi:hypothetical protein
MATKADVERWRDELTGLRVVLDEPGDMTMIEFAIAHVEIARTAVPAMADMIARLALALRDYADLYGATTDAALVLAEYDGRDSITMEARGRPWREWLGKEVNDGD